MTKKNVKLQPGLPAIGTHVDGRYELMGLLGRGGFGAVYLARQISMDREVALKILLSQSVNMKEMVQRFKREVMAIRNLSHPNTIQIYDFNTSKAGFLYYAMESVKGPTLKHVIKNDGPLPPSRVRHITRQILKSLSEAHASRIVHRDLKPANIMLAEMHGEVDFVKVLDFGIAKLLDTEDGEEELTNAGVLIGTISYMSPEQISSKNIGATTDIYALGLIGIEMLSGQSVFAKSGKWEILNKQISSDPIETPDFVQNDPIGRVFMKAVSKDPEERYQTALEMIKALDDVGTCAKTPLSQKGWKKSAKSGVKAASISQSGPISNSGPIPTQDTPNQPIPLSPDDLEEIPALVDRRPLPTAESAAVKNSDYQSDATSHVPSKFAENKTAILIAAAIAGALLLIIGVVLLTGDPAEEVTPEIEKEVVVENVAEEIKLGTEEKSKRVYLRGPKFAEVFSDADEPLGDLPLEVSVDKPTTFKVKAKGHEDKELVISPSSSDEIFVAMTEVKAEPKRKEKKKKSKKKSRKPPKKKEPKKVEKKTKKKSPDWAPIKKTDKVKAWD